MSSDDFLGFSLFALVIGFFVFIGWGIYSVTKSVVERQREEKCVAEAWRATQLSQDPALGERVYASCKEAAQ